MKTAEQILMGYYEQLKKTNPNFEVKGYSPYYFVFNQDVLHFYSTKLNSDKKHGWTFGIWARYDKSGNITGCTYFGEANEFMDKFKPSRTNISTDSAEVFLRKVAELEKDPKQGFIDEYFADDDTDGVEEYNEYFAEKEQKEKIKEESLELLKTELPRLAKEAGLGLRGIAIEDRNWSTGWLVSPRYRIHGWESNKTARTATSRYWQDFEDRILTPYNKKLESLAGDFVWLVRTDFEIDTYEVKLWTKQEDICRRGRYITFFEPPIKKQKHPRKIMIAKAKKGMRQ
jgi:hypothetical protein